MTPKIPCAMLAVAVLLAGCHEPAPPPPEARPVRTVTVERRAGGEPVSLTGQVRAKDQVKPRLSPRRTHDRAAGQCRRLLKAGQVVARLDPQNQQNALRSAQANLVGGRGPADPGAPHLRAAAGSC